MNEVPIRVCVFEVKVWRGMVPRVRETVVHSQWDCKAFILRAAQQFTRVDVWRGGMLCVCGCVCGVVVWCGELMSGGEASGVG